MHEGEIVGPWEQGVSDGELGCAWDGVWDGW